MPYTDSENQRKYNLRYQKNYHDWWRIAAIMILGGKCELCSWNDMRALQIDHVNGDGVTDRGSRKGGGYFYRRVVHEYASGKYQLLCANHNWIKRFERGEHT